jgi:hypothetical protein
MYHQVNINTNNSKTSSSTSTASSMSSTNPGNSNLNLSPFPVNLESSNMSDFVSVNNEQIRLDQLPTNVRFELDQLELELLEGDLTQKGYEKKKSKLLEPYLTHSGCNINTMSSCSTSTITITTPKFLSMYL